MILKYFFFFLFSLNFLCATSTFESKQKTFQDIKKIVQNEESIARAYEKYILDKYNIPSSINDLYTVDYLGDVAANNSFIASLTDFSTNFNTFSIVNSNQLSYALKDVMKNNSSEQKLYESNTFRKRTYFADGKVYFILEDEYAKHLLNLINRLGSEIRDCTSILSKKYCIKENHIYLYTSDSKTTVLFYYHQDKFRSGPILISNDTTLHDEEEFNYIPKGALLYDTKGAKFIKTTAGIEVLK